MYHCRPAYDRSLLRRSQKVRFELDRGKVLRAPRQVRKRAVTAASIRQCNHRGCMQVAIGREVIGPQDEAPRHRGSFELEELDTEHAGECAPDAPVCVIDSKRHAAYRLFEIAQNNSVGGLTTSLQAKLCIS